MPRFILPVSGTQSQAFGNDFIDPVTKKWYYKQIIGQNGHNGNDYAVNTGTPVLASGDGTIYFEGWGQNSSWMGVPAGICVLINHGDVFTGYAHLQSTIVNRGQQVKQGQVIGFSDSSGAATGPHLHFEFIPSPTNWNNGYAGRVNPTNYLNQGTSAPTGSNKDMTPNLIRKTYYFFNGATPTQAEIDFHMSKSNPDSFINGFGDTPLWVMLSREKANLIAEKDSAVTVRDIAIQERSKLAETLGQSNAEVTRLTQEITSHDDKIAELNKLVESKNTELAKVQQSGNLEAASIGQLFEALVNKITRRS